MDVLVRLVTFGLAMLVVSWGALFVVTNVSAGGSDGDPHAAYAAARDDEPSPLDARMGDGDDDGDDGDVSASADRSRDITTRDVSRSFDRSWDATGDKPGKPDRSASHDFSRDRTGDHDTADVSKSQDVSSDQTTGDWSRDDTTSGD
ncbi:MAG: hypothetical protein GXY02_05465 [Actinobacteria bacterium]|nr:hypothetical protein [Actinomycetota bacterium]